MEYAKEHLEKLPLYNLRQIGRESGVRAPTTYTKPKLIQAIIDVESGKIPPYISSRKRGPNALFAEEVIKNEKILEQEKNKILEKLNKIKQLVITCEKEILETIKQKI